MSTMASALPVVPTWEPRDQWLSTEEYAKLKGRSLRTVQYWCEKGVLRDFNIPFYRDGRGRWWIKHIP